MARLRVIAVEKVFVSGTDEIEPSIACVIKDRKLHVYDTFGELYHQKEYFGDFDSLKYLINKGKYEWSDFYIEKGQLITRDIDGNVVVEGDKIEPFLPFEDSLGQVSNISVKVYYEFLKTCNKSNPDVLKRLKEGFESGNLKVTINAIVEKSPFNEFNNVDKELIVRSKTDGYKYLVDAIKENLKSNDLYKYDNIHYLFSRLFKLEKKKFVELNE